MSVPYNSNSATEAAATASKEEKSGTATSITFFSPSHSANSSSSSDSVTATSHSAIATRSSSSITDSTAQCFETETDMLFPNTVNYSMQYISNYFSNQQDQETLLALIQSQSKLRELTYSSDILPIICALHAAGCLLPKQENEAEIQNIVETKDVKDSKKSKEKSCHDTTDIDLLYLYHAVITHVITDNYLKPTKRSTDILGAYAAIEMQFANELKYLAHLAYKGLQATNTNIIQPNIFAAVDEEFDEKIGVKTRIESTRIILQLGLLRPIISDENQACKFFPPSLHEYFAACYLQAYKFLHPSLQEYFAACYVVEQLKSNDQNEVKKAKLFLRMEKYNPKYNMVFDFAAALVHGASNAILESFWQELIAKPFDITSVGHISLMIRCLDACGFDARIPDIQTKIKETQHWLQNIIVGNNYPNDCVLDNLNYELVSPLLKNSSAQFARQICNDIILKAAKTVDTVSGRSILEKMLINLSAKVGTPELLDWLIVSLDAKEKGIRDNAMYVIGLMREKAATTEILNWCERALDTKDKNVRCDALQLIESLGKKAATPKILYKISLALDEKEDKSIKRAALSAIEYGLRAKAATPEILSKISIILNTEEKSLKISALGAIRWEFEEHATPEILSAISMILSKQEKEVKEAALGVIASFKGKAATPEILSTIPALLDEKDISKRYAVAAISIAFGAKAATPEILHKIKSMLGDEEEDVRIEAVHAIQRILGEKAGMSEVQNWIREKVVSKEEHERIAAFSLILAGFKIDAAKPEILGWIQEALEAKAASVRIAALNAIQEIGLATATPEILSQISKILDDKEEKLKIVALNAVGWGWRERAATPQILSLISAATQAKEVNVRIAALNAIKDIGIDAATPEILSQIRVALDAKESSIRKLALDMIQFSFGKKAATPEILSWISETLDSKDDSVISNALGAIRWGLREAAATPEILRKVITLLDANAAWIKMDAVDAMEQLLGEKSMPLDILYTFIFKLSADKECLYGPAREYFLKISLSDLLLKYFDAPTVLTPNKVCFVFVQLALMQSKAITITDNQVKIHDSKQVITIEIPTKHSALIAELQQTFAATLNKYSLLNSEVKANSTVTENVKVNALYRGM